MNNPVERNPKVKELIDLFFDQAAYQPDEYVQFFKKHIKGLTSEELWLLMNALTDRLGVNIEALYNEKMGQAV